jgi:aryl-alcohol dehydrogenase-like predicted oxidoreductase
MGGGSWKFGWGDQDDTQSILAVHRALDLGVNWIDTAAIYGHGHAEEVMGRAIQGRRDSIVLATKCGRVWEQGSTEIGKCLRRASIKRELEASLKRMSVEVVDLYQIHWPEPDEDIEEGWEAVSELKQEGKIRYGGVSNFSRSQLERIGSSHPLPVSLQSPYSMICRDIETDEVPYCLENDIGILAYSPMQAGLLTGAFSAERVASLASSDWRRKDRLFKEPQLSRALGLVELLRELAGPERTPAQLAIAWVLWRPEVTAAIVGARRPEQIEETARAAELVLGEAEQAQIEQYLQQEWGERQG